MRVHRSYVVRLDLIASRFELEGDGASYRVEHLLTPTLIAAIGLPYLELAAALPFGVMAGDRDPDRGQRRRPELRPAVPSEGRATCRQAGHR